MVVLSVNNIEKIYGTDVILENVSFHLNEGDRVGIVGDNGAGKSTLLNIISGDIDQDRGDVHIPADISVGYLKQRDNFSEKATVYEEMTAIFVRQREMEKELQDLSLKIAEKASSGEDTKIELNRHERLMWEYEKAGGYKYKSEIVGILGSMGFSKEFYDKKISTLSGGERTRLALAALLLKKPELLLLDEPTNHLDIGTLKWLEQYLKGYTGTILAVSHDRYFLDQTVNRILEIENHNVEIYNGKYSDYAAKKKEIYDNRLKEYYNQKQEVRRQEEMIRKMKERGTEKLAKRAASREKYLNKMEMLDKPVEKSDTMGLTFKEGTKSGKDVLTVRDLSKSIGFGTEKRQLFSHIDLDIKRGEKICLVGQNGIGKTTFLKTVMGILKQDEGYIKTGTKVSFGYYDQEQKLLNDENTVIDEIHSCHRLYSAGEIRGILGRFLFKDDMVFNMVGSLSGGEKARLSLLKIMMSGANFLIFDEPTNHLDIRSKEIFEDAVMNFSGTVLVVSHDRYFLNKVPNRIIELSADKLLNFIGGYDYYMEKRESLDSGKNYLKEFNEATQSEASKKITEENRSKILSTKQENIEKRKREKAKEAERRKTKKEKERLEKEIEAMEAHIAELEELLCSEEVFSDLEKSRTTARELEDVKMELDEKYSRWEEIAD